MKTAHDVKLLNGSKQEVTYPGVETVTMPGTDGQDKVFTAGVPIDALEISPDFSGGDMPLEVPEGYVVRGATIKKPDGAEQLIAKGQTLAGIVGEYVTPGTAKEIEPNFSEGDQTVTAEGDERWNEVTVKKPETLVPGNILKGVDVAGVIGALDVPKIIFKKIAGTNETTGIKTLITAEELETIGFADASQKFVFLIDGSNIAPNVSPWNVLSYNYIRYPYFMKANSSSSYYGMYSYRNRNGTYSNYSGTNVLGDTVNPWDGVTRNNTAYYEEGEIRYNLASSSHLGVLNNSFASWYYFYVIAGVF